jgi:hypothetical protein
VSNECVKGLELTLALAIVIGHAQPVLAEGSDDIVEKDAEVLRLQTEVDRARLSLEGTARSPS